MSLIAVDYSKADASWTFNKVLDLFHDFQHINNRSLHTGWPKSNVSFRFELIAQPLII